MEEITVGSCLEENVTTHTILIPISEILYPIFNPEIISVSI